MEARLSIGFFCGRPHSQSGKKLIRTKMAMRLGASGSLDRGSASRDMRIAAFNVLPSVGSTEKVWHNRDIAPVGVISRVVFSQVLAIPIPDRHPI